MNDEYGVARSHAVHVARPDRRFLRVHGRDPVRMVQGLITNDLARIDEGRAVYAAVLTAKGRMVADVRIVGRGAELLLETDAAALEPLAAHLRKFVPPLFARFDSADEQWSALTVAGPASASILQSVLGSAPPAWADEDALATVALEWGSGDGPADAVVIASSYGDVPGHDVLLPAAAADEFAGRLSSAGSAAAAAETLDVLRVEAGRPRWGLELTDTTIPLEAGLRERAISESKGCYTGQEVIVRILHRGHVNWQLRGLLLGQAAPPAAGAQLVNDAGKVVARITSAVRSPRHGQTIALGYVRREVEPPARLFLDEVGGVEVGVSGLPFREPAP